MSRTVEALSRVLVGGGLVVGGGRRGGGMAALGVGGAGELVEEVDPEGVGEGEQVDGGW